MPPPVSKLGPAQDTLAAAVQANARQIAGLSRIVIPVGEPPREPKKTEAWVDMAVPDWLQTWVSTGATGDPAPAAMEETFTIAVYFVVLKPAAGNAGLLAARDLGMQIAQAVSDAVRADPSLGGNVFEAEIGGGAIAPGVLELERFVVGRVDVKVKAELA